MEVAARGYLERLLKLTQTKVTMVILVAHAVASCTSVHCRRSKKNLIALHSLHTPPSARRNFNKLQNPVWLTSFIANALWMKAADFCCPVVCTKIPVRHPKRTRKSDRRIQIVARLVDGARLDSQLLPACTMASCVFGCRCGWGGGVRTLKDRTLRQRGPAPSQ